MRTSLIPLAAMIAAMCLAACDDQKDATDLLSPTSASGMLVPNSPIKPFPPRPIVDYIVDITAGSNHVCARTRLGFTSCWGSNSYGQIGVASTATCGLYGYGLTPCVPHPTQVTGSSTANGTTQSFTTASRVSAGGDNTCALSGGIAWCWGNNMWGQVGNGTVNGPAVTSPSPVPGGPFTTLSAATSATCGISSTMLYCWGFVGTGTPTTGTPYLVSWNTGWSDNINVGSGNACAQWNGSWGCWGSNAWGQIGADPAVWQYFDGPLANSSFAGASNVVSSSGYTCWDTPSNTIQCVGKNDRGQLGDQTFVGDHTYSTMTVGGPSPRALGHVAIGSGHACGLDATGAAFCWGDNPFGELGNGTSGNTLRDPVAVSGGLTFTKLAAGMYHTCGLTTDARVFCWGSNYFGQLGMPNSSRPLPNPTPVQVAF